MIESLLERSEDLAVLEDAEAAAARGTGSVVLVTGEAGIGKTSLVRAFVRGLAARTRVLEGACDDLVTARPLGPLRDAATGAGPALRAAVSEGSFDAVLAALVAELSEGDRSTVLVIEDVHWADDATLDVLSYVGRRIEAHRAVLVITFRDGEVGTVLRRVLGGLAGGAVRRLALGGLSRTSVSQLAGVSATSATSLHELTAGNPFFVSELLGEPPRRVRRPVRLRRSGHVTSTASAAVPAGAA